MKPVRLVAPPAVRWITRTLEDAGFETWAVGGAVRNTLLGLPSGDWDLTTRARPTDVRRVFRRTVPIGIDHGTVGVLARDGTMYEVTTFRRDVRTDGRHAVVEFADRLEEDLGRRDFTVNAIAWHPLREELADPYDGVGDLERRVLRTVGEPDRRFAEDYLRVLRAFRFAGRFDLRVEEATWAAACSAVGHTARLSAERIRDELVKVLADDPAPARALGLYAEAGALRVLYPELEALRGAPAGRAEGVREAGLPDGARPEPARSADGPGPTDRGEAAGPDLWTLAVARVSELPPGRPWLRLAALLRDVPPEGAAALLVRLRLSNRQTDEVARLAGAPPLPGADESPEAVRRWLGEVGPDRLAALARIELADARARARLGLGGDPGAVVRAWRAARAVRAARPPLTVRDLAIDGRDLVALGLRPGPRFGRILDALLSWVLEDPERNRREVLRERARALAEEDGAARA